MPDMKPCPPIKWTDLPQFKRSTTPGVVMFAPLCLPGISRNGSCSTDNLRYMISVPWKRIFTDVDTGWTTEQAWTAPGGNRYYWKTVPARGDNPIALALLRGWADVSRARFRQLYNKTSGYAKADRNKPLKSLLDDKVHVYTIRNGTFKSVWRDKYGVITVETAPKTGETIGAFVDRGGYLLDTLLVNGKPVNDQHRYLKLEDAPREPWMSDKIDSYELQMRYWEGENFLVYRIRIEYNGSLENAYNWTTDKIKSAAAWACDLANDPRADTAIAAAGAGATLIPVAVPYVAAVATTQQGVKEVCATVGVLTATTPAPPCIPRTEPGGVPTFTQDGGPLIWNPLARKNYAQSVGSEIPKGAGALAPVAQVRETPPAPQPDVTPTALARTWPDGSITWRDPQTPGYDVAVPAQAQGLTHRVVAIGVPQPADVRVVNRTEWERAVLPWNRRRSAKIGLGVGGVAIAAALTAIALR